MRIAGKQAQIIATPCSASDHMEPSWLSPDVSLLPNLDCTSEILLTSLVRRSRKFVEVVHPNYACQDGEAAEEEHDDQDDLLPCDHGQMYDLGKWQD